MAYLVEQMRRIAHMGLVIRLWIDSEDSSVADSIAHCVAVSLVWGSGANTITAATIMHAHPRISAIEILREGDGNGIVLYRDWP